MSCPCTFATYTKPLLTSLFLLALCLAIPAQALEATSNEGTLPASGRTQIEEMRPHAGEAVQPELEAVLTLEAMRNVRGGLHTGNVAQSKLDLIFELSTEERGWWSNGHFRASLMARGGGHPSALAGDTQVLSNIDAPGTLRLYDLWYQHQWLEKQVKWLVGLHDYNTDFNVSSYGGLFMNSSFGVTPELSQVGPSIFPAPALGSRLRLHARQGTYLMAGVYDGVPGEPAKPHGTGQSLRVGDGLFWALETGWVKSESPGPYSKLSVGLWSHNSPHADLQGNPRAANQGGYIIAEHTFSEALGVFIQAGAARADRNQIGRYLGTGFNYKGLLRGRDDDVLGLAWNQAQNSDDFLALNPGTARAESVLELTYRAQLSPYLFLQPDLQYIVKPGMDATLEDAFIMGVRLVMTPELSGVFAARD